MWTGGVRVIVVDEQSRILMVRQHHEGRDIWMAPGGGVEEGEDSRQAGAREVLEETGLKIRMGRLLWHVEEVSAARGQRFVDFFLARIDSGRLSLGEDPELAADAQVLQEARFMSRAEVKRLQEVYPEFLRDELWQVLAGDFDGYDPFKRRT